MALPLLLLSLHFKFDSNEVQKSSIKVWQRDELKLLLEQPIRFRKRAIIVNIVHSQRQHISRRWTVGTNPIHIRNV